MNVKQLKTLLEVFPEDMEIALYNQMSEDSSMAESLEIHSKENGPYNKGDDVWDLWQIDKNKSLLFIK